VMYSVTAAAGGQARLIAGREDGRQRPQPAVQNQENGERAPHLEFILQDE
jgi:hypothetical protein